MPIDITAAQKTSAIDPTDTLLDTAFASGVTANSVAYLAEIEGYAELTSTQKDQARSVFMMALAAYLKNQAGVSVVVSYRKSDGVSNGSLTFTNGVLTAST